MSAAASPARRAAPDAALAAIPAAERLEPWLPDFRAEADELRERVGIYLGRDPDTLTPADIEEFQHVSRGAVAR